MIYHLTPPPIRYQYHEIIEQPLIPKDQKLTNTPKITKPLYFGPLQIEITPKNL